MTTIANAHVKCSICGKESTQGLISSTNTTGFPDLDFRPPQMQRGTMLYWVHRCPGCGYCASDLTKKIKGAKDYINSSIYKDYLKRKYSPALANTFVCQAFILKNSGQISGAGWAMLHAAWVCDDARRNALAKEYRVKASALFFKVRKSGQEFAKSAVEEDMVLTDILRRSGPFEKALAFCNEAMEKHGAFEDRAVFRFQKKRIELKISAGYTFFYVDRKGVEKQSDSACARLLPKTHEKIWRRGEKYADEGRIKIEQMDEKSVKATAHGTDYYHVEISISSKNSKAACGCPYQGTSACKHIIATAIVWDEKRGIRRPDTLTVAEKTMPEPDNSGRNKITQMYAEPLKADLNDLRHIEKLTGGWSRPHAKLPDMPSIDINPKEPLTMKEVEKALKQIVKWSSRSAYDHYFCAGEMIAAFCEVMKVIKSRLPATDISLVADILLFAQQFHNKEFLQSIDDSEGMRVFSEAYLDDLAFACTYGGASPDKLDEFERKKGDY